MAHSVKQEKHNMSKHLISSLITSSLPTSHLQNKQAIPPTI